MPQIVAGMARLTLQLEALGLQFTPEDVAVGAYIILDKAVDNCPVDTGYLRSTAFSEITDDDVIIGFSAEYASYLEFGTYKMQAQPYLRPALDEAGDEALKAIVASVESHTKDIT